MHNLEISIIDQGIIKCCNQATELIKDGDILVKNKRFSTAFSLYQLASEESSKIKILMRLVFEKRSGIIKMDAERGKYFQKLFHSHIEKNKLGLVTDQNFNVLAKKLNIPKFRDEPVIQQELDNTKKLDELKQDGFYVSIKGNKFVSPSEMITEQKCSELREIVVFRHLRQKETMEAYFETPDFYVSEFTETRIAEHKANKK
jgi:AbiV family abortive infection protein